VGRRKTGDSHLFFVTCFSTEQRAVVAGLPLDSWRRADAQDTLDWMTEKLADETAENRRRGMAIVKMYS
jgi:hypothetical protein